MSTQDVAAPRRPTFSGTYTGEELRVQSARPGAYDALKIPSVIGNRKVYPGTPREPEPPRLRQPTDLLHRTAPASLTLPTPQPWGVKGPKEYTPEVGGLPHRLVQALRNEGGYMSMGEIARRFAAAHTSLNGILRTPIERGALVRHGQGRHRFISLPGFEMPPEILNQQDPVRS